MPQPVKIKVKLCPFGCEVEKLEVFDRGKFIHCRECGIKFYGGLDAWNKRKRGDFIELTY